MRSPSERGWPSSGNGYDAGRSGSCNMKKYKWHLGVPSLRMQTYKAAQQAKRSFYKYVCKEGLFTNLVNAIRPAMSNPYNPYSFFLSGYPIYNAPNRSSIRDRWEKIGDQRLKAIRICKEEAEWIRSCKALEEKERHNAELAETLKGTGITAWDAYRELIRTIPPAVICQDLIEAHAFILAIKATLKSKTYEQHHRTPKRTLQSSSRPTEGRSNRKGCNRNDQRRRKSPAFRQVTT